MNLPRFLALALGVAALVPAFAAPAAAPAPIPDPRHISRGWPIPSKGYADQPYIVQTDDGAWLCAITTGAGREGSPGQHVVSMRSTDRGRTWESQVAIEPPDGPEASYVILLKVPTGRVYAFYNHNTDRVPEVKREDRGTTKRVDSLGYYVFKYSDDHGRSWSARRHVVPVREFEADRKNIYGGKIRFFWNVGRPLILGDAAYLTLHKVGAMGVGFFAQSEGAFLKSKNILTERDPEKITFETLPEGEIGLRAPPGGGRIAEEQSLSALSDGSLFCVYRTVDGWPVTAYSRDGARTWTPPAYMTYAPGGPRVKNPRAANFAWRCGNGKFLYWFHNHGGAGIATMHADASGATGSPYNDRNPAWLMAGEERDTPQGKVVVWSQPEILLYDDDPFIRMSYPDLIERDGRFWITETQKHAARLHEIPADLLAGLFNQSANRTVARAGLALDLAGARLGPGATAKMPVLPEFHSRDAGRPDYGGKDHRAGFTLELWFELDALTPGRALFDSRDAAGRGVLLTVAAGGALHISLNDGRTESAWRSDAGKLAAGKRHHAAVTVDGGPKIITFVVDGVLHDGGDERQFGWGRYSAHLRAPNGAPEARLDPAVRGLRLYTRALRTSEAVGNFRAGP